MTGDLAEPGPAVLRPDKSVFATGATSNTAIYNSIAGTWSVGPSFPDGFDIADGPAALLPNGNVIMDTSRGVFQSPTRFFEFNGTSLAQVPDPPGASSHSSFQGRMLVLPTGQILFTDSNNLLLYTSTGTYQNAWRPTVTSVASTVAPGGTNYLLTGTQLNGLSEGAMYGDDAQSATNYPLVRITNDATQHVRYARTHGHSTMGVATGAAIVSTRFDVPADVEPGPSHLEVVANGIPSQPVAIQVESPVRYLGNLDRADCVALAGWAADQNRLNTSIQVSIYDGSALVTTFFASASRPDVGSALGDNGLHGFSIATPWSLQDGTPHQVHVRFEGSLSDLVSSPATLSCAPPPPPPVAQFTFSCTSLSCAFDAGGSTGSGLTYAWTFGDSGTGAGGTITHPFPASGRYLVTLTVTDSLGRTAVKAKFVSVSSDPLEAAENYFSVSPCRILDTRNTTILTSGQVRVLNIASNCGIPFTAKAVSLNVTALSPTGSGKVRLYPGNLSPSWSGAVSSVNFIPATSPRANSAVIRLATDSTGTIALYPEVSGSTGQVHLILDVQGYFSTDTSPVKGSDGPFGFQVLPPCRLADTRLTSSPLQTGVVRTFSAQGICGVPTGSAVASLHVGVPAPASGGHISLFANTAAVPAVSTINFNGGIGNLRNGARVNLSSTTPDFSALFVGSAGTSVDAYFDVNGYFKSDAPLKYRPITPCRVLESGELANGSVTKIQVQGNCGVPIGAKAAQLRIVVASPTSAGDLTVYPSDLPLSANAVSTVKFDAHEPALSMGTTVALSTLADDLALSPGQMSAGGTVIVSIDVFGYFQ